MTPPSSPGSYAQVSSREPDARDEAVRDVCRARTDASEALARSKQQLGMFLLRNGIHYDGKTNWAHAHMNYLRGKTLPLPHPPRGGQADWCFDA